MTPEDKQFVDNLEAKKIIANRKDRSLNTDKIISKLDELKPEPMPEIPLFPETMKVKLEGIEVLTIKGDKGDTGEKGDKGDTGEQGVQGISGTQGEKGDTGSQGETGKQGEPGKDGIDGIDGKDGKDGAKGDTGTIDTETLGRINSQLEGISFLPRSLDALYDVNLSVRPTNNQTLVYNALTNKWIAGTATGGSGATAFTQLTDVPNSYVGQGGKAVRVNAGETALEFFTAAGSGTVTNVASADGSITVTNPTTTVDLAVVKAPKWSTARNLAGNSVDGSADVAFANKFIVQGTADSGLSAAQFLGALATGILKNTTTTGVLSIAVAGDFPTLNQNTTGSAATLTTVRTIWGQNFDGSANVTGSLTAVADITGGASSMTITAGTGNSRTLTLRSTTSGGTATAFLTGNADQSSTFGGNISGTGAWTITGGAGNMTIISGTGASRTMIFQTTTSGSTATTALTLGADQSATFAGTVALGANNLTMTGSLAATGARVTKGWFTDLESTNMPTVGGTAILTSLTAPQFTTIELGAASDTTISRVSAGVIAVEGVTIATSSNTLTFSNKTIGDTLILAENASIGLDPAGSADGKYTGITVTATAGYTQAFGDLVYLDPTDSRWELCDSNSAQGADGDSRGIIGIVVVAGTDGNACTILLHGIIRADAKFPTFTVNNPIYVSETAGAVTQTQPTTTDVVIRIVGFGITADEMYFNPENDYITHT